jgi:hypothetical protein
MCKLHLTEHATIIKNNQEIILTQSVYNITDEKLIKDNGFFKCWKCKDYFDVANNFGQFHPKYTQDERDYCNFCFASISE